MCVVFVQIDHAKEALFFERVEPRRVSASDALTKPDLMASRPGWKNN